MAAVLHLLKGDAALALPVIERQLRDGDHVTVAVLEGTAPPAGLPGGLPVRRVAVDLAYPELLELVFAADQVISW
jgi:hypothetical protein